MTAETPGNSGSSDRAAARFWCRAVGDLALLRDEGDTRPLMCAGKPLALLVQLALAPGGRSHRDYLAELLWPPADHTDPRHSLRQSLYRLRAATDGIELVETHGAELTLLPFVSFDFIEGEQALADGDLERACALLGGTFLNGFSIPESREFETWAESQRTRFREAWVGAARLLSTRHLEQRDFDRALRVAEEVASVRPLDDEPVHLVMRALSESGRHAAAVARYHAYADLLRAEIETEPESALTDYANELEAFLVSRTDSAEDELPFVGRAEEWAQLESAWDAVCDGASGTRPSATRLSFTRLLEGAAGLGKTRLLVELIRRVRAAQGLVLEAKCYEIERTVPYGTLVDGLAGAIDSPVLGGLGSPWLAELARLLPEIRERYPDIPPAGDGTGSPAAKRRLHQAIARLLERLSEEAPVLLAIDDAHWSDVSSLEVLHFLAHKLRDARVLVVATYRPAELTPAARRFTRSLLAAKLGTLIALEPLSAEDVAELLERRGHFGAASVGRMVSKHLYAHSAGNPLFLSELLDALARDRVLWVSAGEWNFGSRSRIEELPRTLGKLLSDRVDALDPLMRACAETLAVNAGETSVEVLARVLNISEPRAEVSLAVLVEDRIARPGSPGHFELIHDELRRLAYQGIPDGRRRVLHLEVGAALEELGEERRPGGAARLAFHFGQGGDAERAHQYSLRAAGEAEALTAPDAQREHLERATAHAPRALPPGSSDTESASVLAAQMTARGRARHWLRSPIAAGVGAIGLIGAGVIGAAFVSSIGASGPADFRQGTVYLAHSPLLGATHRLEWSPTLEEPGTLVEIEHPDDLPPLIWWDDIVLDGRRSQKLFRLDHGDTVRFTDGANDDYAPRWSPDGRYLLASRGWMASEDRYITRIVRIEPSGRVSPLTHTEHRDDGPTLHPSGVLFAFRRDSVGSTAVWMADADGSHAWNVSERFGLPPHPATMAFSPAGDRLALAYANAGSDRAALRILNLDSGLMRSLPWPHPGDVRPNTLLWSPDGRWLLYSTSSSVSSDLWAVAADGTAGPFRVANLPRLVTPKYWRGGPDRYATRVRIARAGRSRLELDVGEGKRVSAWVETPSGEPLDVPVRWRVAHGALASVDSLGFVRGRSPGNTQLIVSAGGILSDSVALSVRSASLDTLFVEDWTAGLDASRWRLTGLSPPVVLEDATSWRSFALLSHGGARSEMRFDPTDSGFTVEVEGSLRFTGSDAQDWAIALTPDSGAFEIHGPRTFRSVAQLMVTGPGPDRPLTDWTACTSRPKSEPEGEHSVHRFAIQVRPDTVAECFKDGILVGRQRIAPAEWGRPLAIVLWGRSYATQLLHGPVVVTRGLRY